MLFGMCSLVRLSVVSGAADAACISSELLHTERHHISVCRVCVYGLLILCRDTVLFCAAARSGLGTGALWALCAQA